MNRFPTGENYKSCPVCKSLSNKLWCTVNRDNQRYRIVSCNSCSYTFVNPRPTCEFLLSFYSAEGTPTANAGKTPTPDSVLAQEALFPNSSLDSKRIAKTLSTLSNNQMNSKFLDVGCGSGFFSRAAKEVGFDVTAIEIAQLDIQIAKKIAGIEPINTSFEEFQAEDCSYDAILISQVLEHALDVDQWIEKAQRLLKPGGILVVAVPNFGSLTRRILQERDPFICPPEHLNYFDGKTLSKLFSNHGLITEETQWVSRFPNSAFQRRMPKSIKSLAPVLGKMANIGAAGMDLLSVGMVVTVYGRKPRNVAMAD